jgi:endonuclease/exonuclease/phosphatase family metal-dependent hydrolase
MLISVEGTELRSIQLSMMTYNAQAGIHHAATLPTAENLEMIAKVIEKESLDILFAQEVMRFDPLVDNFDEFEWLWQHLNSPSVRFTSGRKDPVAPGTAEWGVAVYLATGSIVGSEKYRLGHNRALLRVTASIRGTPTRREAMPAEVAGLLADTLETEPTDVHRRKRIANSVW